MGSLGWPRRRVLLVPGSSSTGRQAAASACASSLAALGWTTNTLDATWLGSHGWGPRAEATFRRIMTVPGLHDAFHYAALRTGNQLALQADAVTRLRLVPRLRDYLDRHPVELVISFSPAGASAVSTVAPRYPFMRHVVLCTDASPHRLWIHARVDLYLVRSAAAEPAVHRFQPEARVVVIPPAVRASSTARQRSGPRESGSVCRSRNAACCSALAARVKARWPTSPTRWPRQNSTCWPWPDTTSGSRASCATSPSDGTACGAFGFTDRMPELMSAADLVITTPGGTCSEARTVGRPLLLLDLVRGPRPGRPAGTSLNSATRR